MSNIISFINFMKGQMAYMISKTDCPRTNRELIEENEETRIRHLPIPKKVNKFFDSWNRIEFEKIPLVIRAQEGIHLTWTNRAAVSCGHSQRNLLG
jgi:hypothetical protein